MHRRRFSQDDHLFLLVNFHVVKIFLGNIEVSENLPAQTEIFHVNLYGKIHWTVSGHSGQVVTAVASYAKGLWFESCRKFLISIL
jgi:hypothetical protein